ncbi:related to nucleoside-diphosphate-sugar epimerases [Cephalotrichum gorgonifer]|uniref:Related to nucleoside-diphosphate-sugar epimerases n=1 Tax=Cephalotrichum gorgonifer TaxID=2041049 RepID=A0AAE8SYS5_9PEZI|nr:related to nucleoside-diphosphate-sugar epimerases [Cephalotrichum gorgonifer]
MAQRIVVTGGCGKVGLAVVSHLLDRGHSVLNVDIAHPPGHENQRCHTLKVDLTNGGQVFGALTSHFAPSEPLPQGPPSPPDVVLHLAGYARNLIVTDDECFKTNVSSTYNLLEAACKLGVRKILVASSICVYGVTYAEGDRDFPHFPVDETTELRPTDAYSLSKLCIENIAKAFAERFGVDIYVLRIGAVVAADDYVPAFSSYVSEPSRWKVHGWSYTDIRDLSRMFELAVEKDGLGLQVFNAVNNSNTAGVPTEELLKREAPDTPITRPLQGYEAPITNEKIKSFLGFVESHDWRKYFPVSNR